MNIKRISTLLQELIYREENVKIVISTSVDTGYCISIENLKNGKKEYFADTHSKHIGKKLYEMYQKVR